MQLNSYKRSKSCISRYKILISFKDCFRTRHTGYENKNVWLTRKTFLYARKASTYFPGESILTYFFHLIIISKGLYNPIHIVLTQQRNWNSWFIPYELCAFDAKMTAYIKYFSINNDILQTNFTLSYKILKCRFHILFGYFVK